LERKYLKEIEKKEVKEVEEVAGREGYWETRAGKGWSGRFTGHGSTGFVPCQGIL
jgi:hypothetical protein